MYIRVHLPITPSVCNMLVMNPCNVFESYKKDFQIQRIFDDISNAGTTLNNNIMESWDFLPFLGFGSSSMLPWPKSHKPRSPEGSANVEQVWWPPLSRGARPVCRWLISHDFLWVFWWSKLVVGNSKNQSHQHLWKKPPWCRVSRTTHSDKELALHSFSGVFEAETGWHVTMSSQLAGVVDGWLALKCFKIRQGLQQGTPKGNP